MMNADGSIIIKTAVDVSQAEKSLWKLRREIEKTEDEITGNETEKSALVQEAEQLQQRMKSARLEAEKFGEEWASGVVGADQEQARSLASLREIEKQYADVVQNIDKIDKKLIPAYQKLDAMQEEAGALAKEVNSASRASNKMAEAHQRATKSMRRFTSRFREIVRGALFFNLLSSSLSTLREWLGKTIKMNEDARQSIAKLKGALLTFAQPLLNVIIPGVTRLAEVLTQVLLVGARLFSAVFGQTLEQAKDSAEALDKESEALEGVGDAASGARKALASFDEINRLTGDTSSAIDLDVITPDFELESTLPDWLDSLITAIEVKIQELKFSWESGNVLRDQEAWKIFLSGVFGAVLGSMFGGIRGAIIGLVLGAAISLVSVAFLDGLENAEATKIVFDTVLTAILGAVLGGKFGGLKGAVIGLLLGVSISIVSLAFEKGKLEGWSKDDTLIVVLSAILGATLGGIFGGFKGAIIGLLLGAAISFVSVTFSEANSFNKGEAIASLRVALLTILGIAFGRMFGGIAGSVIGALFGLTIGFATVAFDPEMEASVKAAAEKGLSVAMFTIVGAIIGAVFGAGVFGGFIGAAIGLTLGLIININDVKWDLGKVLSAKPNFGGDFGLDWGISGSFKSVPGLATGSVVPPNREFLAVLGDNKTETEVVSPLSTMKQAMLEALAESGSMGKNGSTTVILEVDGQRLARATVPYIRGEEKRIGVNLVRK